MISISSLALRHQRLWLHRSTWRHCLESLQDTKILKPSTPLLAATCSTRATLKVPPLGTLHSIFYQGGFLAPF